MAYQITYYRDITMAVPLADMDRDLPDRAVFDGAYPAPADGEGVAVARRHDGHVLYGYGGAWHPAPPAAACAYRRRQITEVRAAALGRLPKTEGGETWELLGADADCVIVRHLRSDHISGGAWRRPQGRIEISWDDLNEAAADNPWYAELLRRARRALYTPA